MVGKLLIAVCGHLEGQKRPILSDGVLFVSPAMADLIEHADDQEMEHLLKNLLPIEIPGLFKRPEMPAPVVAKPAVDEFAFIERWRWRV